MTDMEALPAGCDIPPGRTDRVVSGITGKPLVYFTPDPLPELLGRFLSSSTAPLPTPEGTDAAFLLARSAAQRNIGGIDINLATCFCEILSDTRQLATTADIFRTGATLSPRSASLRQEIVFSGGPIASFSDQIFAPPSELPRLMQALADTMEGLTNGDGHVNPILLAAIVGFYSVHTHPFLDANGRWSRLQSAYAAKTVGSPLTALISATMQSSARNRLAKEIWPATRRLGFRDYFVFAVRYHEAFLQKMRPTLLIASQVHKELKKSISNKRAMTATMIELHTTGRLALSDLRTRASLSMKAASGVASRIIEATGECELATASAIQIHELHERAIKASKECALN